MRLRLCLLTLVTDATALSVAGRDVNPAQSKLEAPPAPPPPQPQPRPDPAFIAPRDSTEVLVQNIVDRLRAVVAGQPSQRDRAVRAAIGRDGELMGLCGEFARRTGTLRPAIAGTLYHGWGSPDATGKLLRKLAGIPEGGD